MFGDGGEEVVPSHGVVLEKMIQFSGVLGE